MEVSHFNFFYLKRIGERVKSRQIEDTPGAGSYTIKPKILQGPKFTFNRSKAKLKTDEGVGPGQYSPKKVLYDYPHYSMRGKYNPNDKNDNPPPWEYNPNKKFNVSSYK